MAKYFVIENSGEIDVRLLHLLGATTKGDAKDKIGIFGSGAKYAIAQALRQNVSIRVTSGKKVLKFKTKKYSVRGNAIEQLVIGVEGEKSVETSITTGMGEQDWKDPWYIIREFVSNALDEGGKDTCLPREAEDITPEPDKTKVYIEATPAIKDVVTNLYKYIRIREPGIASVEGYGRILRPIGEKCRVYKRGIFVLELPEVGIYDYDMTGLQLNESRTADIWIIKSCVSELILRLPPENSANIMKLVSSSPNVKMFESSISEYMCIYEGNKKSLREAFELSFGTSTLCQKNDVLVKELQEQGISVVPMPTSWHKILKDCGIRFEEQILDVFASEMEFAKPGVTPSEVMVINRARELLAGLFSDCVMATKVVVLKDSSDTDRKNLLGIAKRDARDGTWTIGIRENVLAVGVRETMRVLSHEYAHVESGCPDGRAFADVLTEKIISLVLKLNNVIL